MLSLTMPHRAMRANGRTAPVTSGADHQGGNPGCKEANND
jgi:hypothetical protein